MTNLIKIAYAGSTSRAQITSHKVMVSFTPHVQYIIPVGETIVSLSPSQRRQLVTNAQVHIIQGLAKALEEAMSEANIERMW